MHPQSTISDVRFVAYDKDQATVDAFFGLLIVSFIRALVMRVNENKGLKASAVSYFLNYYYTY